MKNYLATIKSQYANSPSIRQLIDAMDQWVSPDADIDLFFNAMWNIDTAVGYGLDCWGRIVGVTRVLQIANTNYFGFSGPSGSSGTGFNQAPFYNGQATTSNFNLTDDAFRALILAKAMFNICDGSISSINLILVAIFGPDGPIPTAGNTYCTDGANRTMTYTFTNDPGPVGQAIAFQSGVLPRPAGIAASVVIL